MAGKSRIWLQTGRHRPAPAAQSYPQHIDNIERFEAFWADKQGIYRASYLLLRKDYPKINTVSETVSQHGKDSNHIKGVKPPQVGPAETGGDILLSIDYSLNILMTLATVYFPSHSDLYPLIRGWRENQFIVITPKGGAHSQIDISFKVAVPCVKGMKHRDEVLTVRIDPLFQSGHGRVADRSRRTDIHIMIHTPFSQLLTEKRDMLVDCKGAGRLT